MERNQLKGRQKVFYVAAVIASCGLLFGFDTGIIADLQWQLTSLFHLSANQWGHIVSSMVLGAAFSAMISGRLVDTIGRRSALFLVALNFIASSILAVFATGYYSLLISRFLIGISIGVSSYTAPLLISEVAPKERRGLFLLLNCITITGGEALSFLCGFLLLDVSPTSFRLLFAIGIIPAVILFVGLFFIPASPRFIAKKKGLTEAKEILIKIRESEARAYEELTEIKKNLLEEEKHKSTSLFKAPYLKLIVIGCLLGVLQQAAGINVVMYYGPFLFKSAGFSESTSLLATFIMGLCNMLITIFSMFIIDKVGRKPLLSIGAFVAGLGMLSLSLQSFYHLHSKALTLVSLMTYTIAFAASLGSIFWVLISELYPFQFRARAMSLATSCQWLSNFVVSLLFLPMFVGLGEGPTMLVLAAACFTSVLFTVIFIPETKGQSLEGLEKRLYNNKKALRFGI